jgi:hypothetical protein
MVAGHPPGTVFSPGGASSSPDAFRTLWAAHNVRYHQTGTKRLHHPVVGDLELSYRRWHAQPTRDVPVSRPAVESSAED